MLHNNNKKLRNLSLKLNNNFISVILTDVNSDGWTDESSIGTEREAFQRGGQLPKSAVAEHRLNRKIYFNLPGSEYYYSDLCN